MTGPIGGCEVTGDCRPPCSQDTHGASWGGNRGARLTAPRRKPHVGTECRLAAPWGGGVPWVGGPWRGWRARGPLPTGSGPHPGRPSQSRHDRAGARGREPGPPHLRLAAIGAPGGCLLGPGCRVSTARDVGRLCPLFWGAAAQEPPVSRLTALRGCGSPTGFLWVQDDPRLPRGPPEPLFSNVLSPALPAAPSLSSAPPLAAKLNSEFEPAALWSPHLRCFPRLPRPVWPGPLDSQPPETPGLGATVSGPQIVGGGHHWTRQPVTLMGIQARKRWAGLGGTRDGGGAAGRGGASGPGTMHSHLPSFSPSPIPHPDSRPSRKKPR